MEYKQLLATSTTVTQCSILKRKKEPFLEVYSTQHKSLRAHINHWELPALKYLCACVVLCKNKKSAQ